MDKYEYWWMTIHNEYLPADISRGEYQYEEIYKMDNSKLQRNLFLTGTQSNYVNQSKNYDIDKQYEEFVSSGVSSVTVRENNFPMRLKYIDDCPYALFYIGKLPKENERNIAIIGSRACSEYGRIMAEKLATSLAKHGFGVISGMALGIDGISQMHCLNAGGKSYGILGGSVLTCYPRSNRILYERLQKNGAVISEYANSVHPKAAFFPKRNRLISGLSDGIVVVQAKIRSGTFITVDYALSQGKDVCVVPGMVTDPLSVGCNLLIMQGAYPVQCAGDIINILDNKTGNENKMYGKNENSDKPADDSVNKSSYVNRKITQLQLPDELLPKKNKTPLTKEEGVIYDLIDYNAIDIEDIANRLDAGIKDILKPLITLEMKGLIRECAKNMYVKCT